ncbi:hypothetical protein V8G54_020908 [Vigna mungo]|uniref:PB1-like domain-containing protein n=1 Tax=Vigna mungo TaxID=3915 RepID=A0AAQ3RV56_VIGMU
MEDDIELVNEGCLKYEGESDTMYFDHDLWSYFVVVSVVKGIGYDGFKDLWYFVGCGPILDDKLEALCDDVGTMHMVNLARLNGQEVAPEMHEGGECVVLDERTEEDDGSVTSQFGEATDDGLDEGVSGDGERIEVDVGEGDRIEVDEDDVEGERIKVHEGHGERTERDDLEGERIEDDEKHDERTKANGVEETIEVDEAHDENTKPNDVEGETMEVDDILDVI